MATHPEELLARAADGAPIADEERRRLEAHLEVCAACRDALEDQRLVARLLQARAESEPAAGFRARVSARLDREREAGGFLDLANWRAWTVGLAPVAAALMLAAYLGVGASSSTTAASADVTFEAWASSAGDTSAAAVFLQPNASGDQLLETVLTGSAPSAQGGGSVR